MRTMQRFLAVLLLMLIVGCVSAHHTTFAKAEQSAETTLSESESTVPQVDFLRRISSRFAGDTTTLTIVYEVDNAGSQTIREITVADSLGNFQETIEVMEPGERRYLIQHVSIESDSVSSPTLEYRSGEDNTLYSTQLEEEPILLAHSLLDVSLTAGRSIFATDQAEVILRLENGGNVAYRNVVIYDDIYGGVIADSILLPAGGEPIEISNSYPLRGTANYRWRITGVNEAGESIDFITETATVYADESPAEVLLTLGAKAEMTRISRKGYVPVTLSLTNLTSGMATNVILREEKLGDIATLAVVPAGEPTQYTLRCEVSEDTAYLFSAVYTDPSGQQRTAEADPIEIIITPGGETPEAQNPQPEPARERSRQPVNSNLFWILLGSACAVLLVLIILLLAATRRDRIERKVREEVRRQRRRELTSKRESHSSEKKQE